MADYNEAVLVDGLSIYANYPESSPVFARKIKRMHRSLDGGGDYGPLASMPGGCETIADGFLSRFAFGVARGTHVSEADLLTSQAAKYLGLLCEETSFSENPDYVTPDFETYGETLLQLIASGRGDLVGPTEEIALNVVRSGRYKAPDGTTGYFTRPSKIGVFALELLAAARGEAVDWDSFYIPPDRFWLDCARLGLTEADPEKAAQWAKQLCDAHMQTLRTDKDNFATDPSTGHEIDAEAHFFWPITVEAFLRMRDAQGLATADFDHPLMRTSYRVLRGWSVSQGSWVAPEWFAEIVEKVAVAAPALGPKLAVIR